MRTLHLLAEWARDKGNSQQTQRKAWAKLWYRSLYLEVERARVPVPAPDAGDIHGIDSGRVSGPAGTVRLETYSSLSREWSYLVDEPKKGVTAIPRGPILKSAHNA